MVSRSADQREIYDTAELFSYLARKIEASTGHESSTLLYYLQKTKLNYVTDCALIQLRELESIEDKCKQLQNIALNDRRYLEYWNRVCKHVPSALLDRRARTAARIGAENLLGRSLTPFHYLIITVCEIINNLKFLIERFYPEKRKGILDAMIEGKRIIKNLKKEQLIAKSTFIIDHQNEIIHTVKRLSIKHKEIKRVFNYHSSGNLTEIGFEQLAQTKVEVKSMINDIKTLTMKKEIIETVYNPIWEEWEKSELSADDMLRAAQLKISPHYKTEDQRTIALFLLYSIAQQSIFINQGERQRLREKRQNFASALLVHLYVKSGHNFSCIPSYLVKSIRKILAGDLPYFVQGIYRLSETESCPASPLLEISE